MSFKFNPLSGDLIALKNENAIARAVRNIVSTTPGEKLFDPDFGSSVGEILFENVAYCEYGSELPCMKKLVLCKRDITTGG